MIGNDKKTATKARERLWPFVTYDQYTQPHHSVKDFFQLLMIVALFRTTLSQGLRFFFLLKRGGRQNRKIGYTVRCI